MITRERLPIQQDLMFLLRWPVEAREQEVQVRRQRPHRRDLSWVGADNLTHRRGRLLREQLPLCEGRVL